MKIYSYRGLTQTEIENVKAVVKAELKGLATVRVHKQKYAAGQIDVRPTKKLDWHWTREQYEQVRAVLESLGLFIKPCENYNKDQHGIDDDEVTYIVYRSGFNFIGISC